MIEIPISGALHGLLGHKFGSSDLVIVYSARLDEAGTDGRSPYTVLAGAVATAGQWDKLEERWDALLMRSKVDAFHYKEFNEPAPPFDRWSGFKRKRFIDSQEKAIEKNTLFRVSIGVENAVHKSIKERMRGIKGFRADSDYALCLRYLMFHTSDQLARIDPDYRLTILVEDGPWAAGAADTYQRVAAMTGKWKPAKHAHRLAGFATAPKGERLSLEAADYIAGTEPDRMLSGRRAGQAGVSRLSCLLTGPLLERWYEGMIKEKEARRAYNASMKRPASEALA